jgi:hypothetical protein
MLARPMSTSVRASILLVLYCYLLVRYWFFTATLFWYQNKLIPPINPPMISKYYSMSKNQGLLLISYSGATHINSDNVHEEWLSDNQASDFAAGVNGLVDRNEVVKSPPTNRSIFSSSTHSALNSSWADSLWFCDTSQ